MASSNSTSRAFSGLFTFFTLILFILSPLVDAHSSVPAPAPAPASDGNYIPPFLLIPKNLDLSFNSGRNIIVFESEADCGHFCVKSGTSIDQGVAYVLMLVALVLTYLIHPLDASSYNFFLN